VRVHVPRRATVDDVRVELAAKRLSVAVDGWPTWTRHLAFDLRPDESTWSLADVDGRTVVECSLTFSNLPMETSGKVERVATIDRLFVEDEDKLFTLALAQVCGHLHYAARFLPEDDLLPDARSILTAMRDSRPSRRDPLASPFAAADAETDDAEKIDVWHTRCAILADRDWRPLRDETKTQAPPRRGTDPPVLDPPLVVSDHPSLFVEEPDRTRRPITTFAWDDAGAFVKVYLSLPVDDLALDDVAVRFRADRLLVHVKHRDDALLCFDTKLFLPVVPNKCTFKCNQLKKVLALGLRKKAKHLPWPSLAADVNSVDTLPTASS